MQEYHTKSSEMAKQENNRMAPAVILNNLRYNSKITKGLFQEKKLFEFQEHEKFETELTRSLEY